MLKIECCGTPCEIGFQHGSAAPIQINRSIAFYTNLFYKNCNLTWPQVLQHALVFEQVAKEKWPAYHAEMQGVADGAGRQLLEIVALNVRTEINFGMFSDGCTSLAWHTEQRAWLGQNWDWMESQKENLIVMKITQPGKPTIAQVTEAGIIGKIGYNSLGVGVCLNAIRVLGVEPTRMPVHFGLRAALECPSVEAAVQELEKFGMASSAHILIADPSTALGLEFTKSTFADCLPDISNRIIHANHLLLEHPGEVDTLYLEDSIPRIITMGENASKLGKEPSWRGIDALFEDEQNLPGAICRLSEGEGTETLFNIVMDLKSKRAVVRLGRPASAEETVELVL